MTDTTGTGDAAASREWIARVPMLRGVSDATLDHLCGIATAVDTVPGQVLTQAGAPGSGLFVIQSGSVEVERPGQSSIELGLQFWEIVVHVHACGAHRGTEHGRLNRPREQHRPADLRRRVSVADRDLWQLCMDGGEKIGRERRTTDRQRS